MPALYDSLSIGDRLVLVREPNNAYDEKAIAVKTCLGDSLGYVPRVNNLILSRLMDAGYNLYAEVRDKSHREPAPHYEVIIKNLSFLRT